MPTRTDGLGGEDRSTRTTVRVALIANVLIVTVKIAAGIITLSPALLSEAAHSAADTLNEVFLLVAVARSRRNPDELHPFGYGKARYFYVMLAAVGIFVTGACFSLYQGITTLAAGIARTEMFGLAYAVLGLSLLADGLSLTRAVVQSWRLVPAGPHRVRRALITERDPALSTVLTEDSTAVVGVLIAATGLGLHQATGEGRWEGIASLLIAVLLGFAALRLGRRSEAPIIGQAADPILVRSAYLTLAERPEVDTVLEFLTMQMGPGAVLLAARIDLADGFDSDGVEDASGRIKAALHTQYPVLEQIFLDVSDATEEDHRVADRRRTALEREAGQS
jgi:cation diffusion facilitator family transporter